MSPKLVNSILQCLSVTNTAISRTGIKAVNPTTNAGKSLIKSPMTYLIV